MEHVLTLEGAGQIVVQTDHSEFDGLGNTLLLCHLLISFDCLLQLY